MYKVRYVSIQKVAYMVLIIDILFFLIRKMVPTQTGENHDQNS
jgi:hypothetical protein